MKKTYKKLTTRERALVVNLGRGMTLTDAAKAAGYSENNPGQSGYQAFQIVKEKMPELLEKHGLTDDALIEKYLKPGLNAMETKFFQKDGQIVETADVIAWGPRRDYLDMALNLKGSYAPKESSRGSGMAGSAPNIQVVVITGEAQ